MPQAPGRGTAEIIPFPKRNSTSRMKPHDAARDAADRLGVELCDFGSGWYHDAAMQEECVKPKQH